MKDTYTIYYSGDKVLKYRTIKSYIKFRVGIRVQNVSRYVRILWNDRDAIWTDLKRVASYKGLESGTDI